MSETMKEKVASLQTGTGTKNRTKFFDFQYIHAQKGLYSMIFIFFVLLLSSPVHLKGQSMDQMITFELQAQPLDRGLKKLGQMSGFQMSYSSQLVSPYNSVSVAKATRSVNASLDLLLANTNLKAIVQGKRIMIVEKNEQEIYPKQFLSLSGKVTDTKKIALPGVSISIKGSGKGTISDGDGKFMIEAAAGDILVLSFIGFITEEYIVGNNRQIEIVLTESSKYLEDIVVVGYGSTRRRDLTGSVSTIDTKELKTVSAISVDDALAGKASGVAVVKADGSPGGAIRIRIRGGASLTGGTDPLYVIDGIPVEVKNNYLTATELVNPMEASNYGDEFNSSIGGAFARGLNNMAGLDINDIESIDILKDASATAIYGSKAANGVVIITTKKGKKESAPQVSLNYYIGFNNPIKEKVLNAAQYKSSLLQAAQNTIDNLDKNAVRLASNPTELSFFNMFSGGARSNAEKFLNDPNFFDTNDTDWLDLVLRTGVSHNLHLAVNGGSQTSRYYTSVSYTQQEGTLISTDFERLSGKIDLGSDISNKVRLGTNINYGYIKNNITNGVYTQALYAPPVFAPYNADGSYATFGELNDDYRGFQNPLAVASSINLAKTYLLKGTISLDVDLPLNLKYRSAVSVDYTSYKQTNYIPSYVKTGGNNGAQDSDGGTGSQAQSTSLNLFVENTLTYDKAFDENHRVNVLAGTSWEDRRMDYFKASGKGYPDDQILNNLGSAAQATSVDGADPYLHSSLLSFYIRANYVFKDRYLLTFTGRSDASSKFAPDNRVGYFPSGALAWRMSEESFLNDLMWIDEIKLRASMGKTGTQNIGDHMWRTLYNTGAYAGSNALYPSQLGNNKIKWEATTQKDLGLDFSFFKSRLSGTIGYYHKITDGALLNITPAPSSGFSTVVYNIAKVRNTGLEIDLRGDFIRNKNFRWNGSLNISHNKSKVLNIVGDEFSSATDRNAINKGNSVIKEGESLGLLYGYKSVGIIKTEQQLLDYQSRFASNGPFSSWVMLIPGVGIGSIEYALNESGNFYRDVIGNSTPKFFGGYTNTLTYKNISLMAHFTYSYGNDLIYLKDVSDMSMTSLANTGIRILDAYTPENQNWNRPQNIYSGMNIYLTDRNVYDASYIKLKTLSLSYNVPQKYTKAAFISNLQVYATASNLFTITSYPGPDPEVSDDPASIIGGGRDISSYPTAKSYIFGVRVSF